MKRWGVVAILVLTFLGLADSAYLFQHDMSGVPLSCSVQGLSNCNVVAQSPYAKLFGIPIAAYGVVFYAALFALAALELVLRDRRLRRTIQGAAALGLAASLYFLYLQVAVIGALCVYCLGSLVIEVLVLLFALPLEPLRRAPAPAPTPPAAA
jgi:uncharacterized membrane protein